MMAKKQSDPAQPETEAPEATPQAGGSYTRNADGTLTQTEGADLVPDVPAPTPDNTN